MKTGIIIFSLLINSCFVCFAQKQTMFERLLGLTDNFGYDPKSVQQTSDGGYIIASSGIKGCVSSFVNDIYLIKTNSYGDTLWTKTYGGNQYEIAFSVQQTTDDGYVILCVTGDKYILNNPGDIFIIKTDSNGDSLWSKPYGKYSFNVGIGNY